MQALWLIAVVVQLIPMVQVPARLFAWSWHVPWLLLLLALAVGLELRHAWARWTSGALVALGTLGAAYQTLAGVKYAPSSVPAAELLGQALAATLFLGLAYRSTLAAPAVRYFTWAPSEPEELAPAFHVGRRRPKSRRRRKRAVVR